MTNLDQIKSQLKAEFSLSDEVLNNLEIYAETLIEENNKYNLTAIKEPIDIYIKHFYDSLLLTKTKAFDPSKTLLDVGTGAGFPGLVIKICYPEMDVTMLDSTSKKCEFLKLVINKLGLKKAHVICSRIEELDENYIEKYDLITARAVAEINILLELSARLLKINGEFIALRGATYLEEQKKSISCLKRLGLCFTDISSFELLENAGTRGIITYTKSEKTDKQFPRRYSQIKKQPL